MPTRTILLADPDPLQQQLVDMLLAADDLHIVTAGNGRDTLEFLREHTPNLAILALELPDIGGDAICRKLKAVTRLSRVPVILTVKPPAEGGLSHDVRQLARSAEADLLLQKPLGDKGLRDKVYHLLRRWQEKEPARPRGKQETNNTVIIEQALQELGHRDENGTATLDAVTEALYRENEDLRSEVASLKRRLARLESTLAGRRDSADASPSFVPGDDPAAPAGAADPQDAASATPSAAAGGAADDPPAKANAGAEGALEPEGAGDEAPADDAKAGGPEAGASEAGGSKTEVSEAGGSKTEASEAGAAGSGGKRRGRSGGSRRAPARLAAGRQPEDRADAGAGSGEGDAKSGDAKGGSGEGGSGERSDAERAAGATGTGEPAEAGRAPVEGLLPDSLPAGASREELQHRIVELERRNRALIAALEEAESAEGAPRGLFGRRKR